MAPTMIRRGGSGAPRCTASRRGGAAPAGELVVRAVHGVDEGDQRPGGVRAVVHDRADPHVEHEEPVRCRIERPLWLFRRLALGEIVDGCPASKDEAKELA